MWDEEEDILDCAWGCDCCCARGDRRRCWRRYISTEQPLFTVVIVGRGGVSPSRSSPTHTHTYTRTHTTSFTPRQQNQNANIYPPRAPADEEEEDDTSDENFLNNGTAPKRGFAFQAFSEPLYGGEASDILTSEGFHDLGFEATSYVWVPNDTGCCISFCQTKNDTEFHWCDPRMRDEVEGESFPRLGVLCGDKMNPFADWFPCAEEDEEEEEEENEEEDGERGPREGGIARRRGE